MLTTIVATVIVLGVLIFVHELGHFMTAKMVDIEVPRFSIGFGPRVLGFKRGETEYVISALPLGGYVKMAGMEEMEQIEGGPVGVGEKSADAVEEMGPRPRRPRDFESKSLPARALVISAGVIMNLLFAFVVFTILGAVWGVPGDPGTSIGGVSEENLPTAARDLANITPGAIVTALNDRPVTTRRELQLELTRARGGAATLTFENAPPLQFELPSNDEERANVMRALEPAYNVPAVLGEVLASGAGRKGGLESGDTVVQVGDRVVRTWQEFVAVIERYPGVEVPVTVSRKGRVVDLRVTPEARVLESGLRVGRIGVGAADINLNEYMPRDRPGPLAAVSYGATQTWDVTTLTVDFLAGLFTGRHSARNVGGPIMIGQMSGRFAREGIEAFLGFMAILSVNLAVLNLLPIPVLDGGHLVFLAVEGVRGRALSYEQRMRLTQVGFVFIILLMAWAIGNDLLRAIGI